MHLPVTMPETARERRAADMLRWKEGQLPMTSLSKLRAEALGVDMVDSGEEAVRNDEGTA